MTKTTRQGRKRPKTFPLYKHKTGQWCKTIRGRKVYFGTDRDEALDAFLAAKDHLYAGRQAPVTVAKCVTVEDVVGSFRASKESALALGELSPRMLKEYKKVCQLISRVLGKTTPIGDVAYADLVRLKARVATGKNGKTTSPISFKRQLAYVRGVFLHANEELNCHVKYRKPLAAPSAKVVRKHRHAIGERLFTAKQIRDLIEIASPQMKAMIWLGVTAGFGNRDCATLPIEQVDLTSGWHNYWRPKTQNPRRAPLTPECAAALYRVIKGRRSGLVFMTKYGQPWYREDEKRCPISAEFKKLCVKLKIYKPGITTFYSLRRTCQTVGEGAGEPMALKFLMGHIPPTDDMSSVYRQKVYDAPLLRISEHIRKWVNGEIVMH
jgi:integrase